MAGLTVRSTFGQHIFLGSYLAALIPIAAARLEWGLRAREPSRPDGDSSSGRRRSRAHDRRLGRGSHRARRPRVAVGSGLVAARPLGRHRGRRLGTRPRALRRDTAPSRSGRGGAPRDPGHRRRPVPGARRLLRDAGRPGRHRICSPRAAPCLEGAGIGRGGPRRRRALRRAVERAHLAPGIPPRDAAAQPSEPSRRRAARNPRLVPPPGLERDARRLASPAWRRGTDSRPFAAREEPRGLRARDPAPDSGSARPSLPGRPAGAGRGLDRPIPRRSRPQHRPRSPPHERSHRRRALGAS